jgi:hypothetical protein
VQSPHSGKNRQKPLVFGAEGRLVTHTSDNYRRNFRQCKGGSEFLEPNDFSLFKEIDLEKRDAFRKKPQRR